VREGIIAEKSTQNNQSASRNAKMNKIVVIVVLCMILSQLLIVQSEPTRPTLPNQFRTTFTFTMSTFNSTFSGQEYYDGNGKKFRVDYSEDGTRRAYIWNLVNNRYYDIDRTLRACNVYNGTGPTSGGPGRFSPSPLKDEDSFFTPAELFGFNENFKYVGVESVRGISCDRYDYTINNETRGPGTFTGTQSTYFAVQGWRFRGKDASRFPVRTATSGQQTRMTRNGTIAQMNIEFLSEYTDFNVDVPADVFTIPEFCIDIANPVPLPNFEIGSYIASLEVVDIASGSISYVDEYWDISANHARINTREKGIQTSLFILEDEKALFQVSEDNKKCTKQTVTSDEDISEAAGLLSVKNLFLFDTSNRFGASYLGQQNVRGVICDRWTATQTLNDGRNYTVEHYFSAQEWNVDDDSDIIPTRVTIFGKDVSGKPVDLSIDVVTYLDITPDSQLFVPPGSCPGYYIWTKSVTPAHSFGFVVLGVFLGIIVGVAFTVLGSYLYFVKRLGRSKSSLPRELVEEQ
jgi:hypothetical protein